MNPAIRFVPAGDPVIPALVRLIADAYPITGLTSADALARYVERMHAHWDDEPEASIAVAEHEGEAVGVMRLYDFTMNFRDRDALVGGVGAVAVSLAWKRRGIARALVRWYMDSYRERGAPLAMLHPFRPDFYRTLGFGYGSLVHRYAFRPAALRSDGARGTARLLGQADLDAVLALSERVRRVTHGVLKPHRFPLARALADAAVRFVGIEDGGLVRAYMQTVVALGPKDTQNRNRLIARDLTYDEPAHLAALLAYLRAQQDQFAEIVIESQDPAFFLAAEDPRDTSDRTVAPPAAHRTAETGLGMMFRILDVEAAFAYLPAAAAPFVLQVDVDDAFYPATAGTFTFRFGPGGPPQRAKATAVDATLRLGIAELSSLVAGSLRLRDLVHHRLASVEPASAIERVARALDADRPPAGIITF